MPEVASTQKRGRHQLDMDLELMSCSCGVCIQDNKDHGEGSIFDLLHVNDKLTCQMPVEASCDKNYIYQTMFLRPNSSRRFHEGERELDKRDYSMLKTVTRWLDVVSRVTQYAKQVSS